MCISVDIPQWRGGWPNVVRLFHVLMSVDSGLSCMHSRRAENPSTPTPPFLIFLYTNVSSQAPWQQSDGADRQPIAPVVGNLPWLSGPLFLTEDFTLVSNPV